MLGRTSFSCLLSSIHFYEFLVFGWQHLSPILISISIAIPIFYLWGLYKAIFRYSGNRAMITLLKAIIVYIVIYFLLFWFMDFDEIPRSISIMQPILLFLLVGSSRWLVKIWLGKYILLNVNVKYRCLILAHLAAWCTIKGD